MRVGLLVCGHLPPEYTEIAGDLDDMFESLLGDRLELRRYSLVDGVFPDEPDENDGWITTGSRFSVFDDLPWIKQFADLTRRIVDAHTPLVGICFGHQMIAHALGGRVERSERGWGVGVKTVEVTDKLPWMEPPAARYSVLNSHQDQVTVLPPGARIIGTNDHCKVSALAFGDRVVGFQGHPEFVPEFVQRLMQDRRGLRIPEEVVDQGLASLETPPDRELLADWIISFLGRQSD